MTEKYLQQIYIVPRNFFPIYTCTELQFIIKIGVLYLSYYQRENISYYLDIPIDKKQHNNLNYIQLYLHNIYIELYLVLSSYKNQQFVFLTFQIGHHHQKNLSTTVLIYNNIISMRFKSSVDAPVVYRCRSWCKYCPNRSRQPFSKASLILQPSSLVVFKLSITLA